MKFDKQDGFIKLPVTYIKGNNGIYYIMPKKTLSTIGFVAMGNTWEEAEADFIKQLEYNAYYELREYQKLNRLAIFQKGDWSRIGGMWFMILGILVHIRIGHKSKIKFGRFIPFTNINISISNMWKNNIGTFEEFKENNNE